MTTDTLPAEAPPAVHDEADPSANPPAMATPFSLFLATTYSLAIREIVRFYRQRSRITGALGQPIIFWILFGAGLKQTFSAPVWADDSLTYQQYFFPGVAAMILLFSSIYSTISIIEDRAEGFLQAVLVSPVPRAAIAFGKILGGSLLAVCQVSIFLGLGVVLAQIGIGPNVIVAWTFGDLLATAGLMLLLSLMLTSSGYLIAWPMESTQGFHAIMMIFLFPMWLISGAFFPIPDTLSSPLAWIMIANPMTYGVAGLQRLMLPIDTGTTISWWQFPALSTCVLVSLGFFAVFFVMSVWLTRRPLVRNAK